MIDLNGENLCPICGSDMSFGGIPIDAFPNNSDEEIGFEAHCNRCDFEGIQWFTLKFSEWTDLEGNSI